MVSDGRFIQKGGKTNEPDVESQQQQRTVSIVGNPMDQILWIEQIQQRISFDSQHPANNHLELCASSVMSDLIQLQGDK